MNENPDFPGAAHHAALPVAWHEGRSIEF